MVPAAVACTFSPLLSPEPGRAIAARYEDFPNTPSLSVRFE